MATRRMNRMAVFRKAGDRRRVSYGDLERTRQREVGIRESSRLLDVEIKDINPVQPEQSEK